MIGEGCKNLSVLVGNLIIVFEAVLIGSVTSGHVQFELPVARLLRNFSNLSLLHNDRPPATLLCGIPNGVD